MECSFTRCLAANSWRAGRAEGNSEAAWDARSCGTQLAGRFAEKQFLSASGGECGAEGVTGHLPLEWVAAHEVAARESRFPPN